MKCKRHRKVNALRLKIGVSFRSVGVQASDIRPCLYGGGSQFSMVGGWNVVAGSMHEIGDWIMDGYEPLKT